MSRDKYDEVFNAVSSWILLFLIVLLTAKSCWHLELVKEKGISHESDHYYFVH